MSAASRSLDVPRPLAFEIGEVDVAVVEAADGDDFHAGHDGAGGIGAVGAGGDETDIAMRFAAGLVIWLRMASKPKILALRTGIRLEGDGGKAGDFRQPFL